MIRFLLFTLMLALLFTFSYTNADEHVVIHYFWNWESHPTRLDLIILASFLAGCVLATIFIIPGWIRSKLESRRLRRALGLLESERDRLRAERLGKQPPTHNALSLEEDQEEI